LPTHEATIFGFTSVCVYRFQWAESFENPGNLELGKSVRGNELYMINSGYIYI